MARRKLRLASESPPIVVGLTVVAFGTSMPELVVNVVGALHGETGLAFGNVVGSNVANLALVLGVAAMLRPLELHGGLVQRELPLLLLGTTVLSIFALDELFEGLPSVVTRSDALVLLLIFSVFIYITVTDVLRSTQKDALVTDMKSNPLIDTQARRAVCVAICGAWSLVALWRRRVDCQSQC